MTRRRTAALAALSAAALFALYIVPISQRGLVGPDEPRYASVAREMAESGDWITPHLWGEPWFEKPALLYWLGAAASKAGLEAYTRVPVALLGLAFLAFLYRKVAEHFDRRTAVTATCLLATSAGWVAYSDAGVFDGPVSVFIGAALLSLLPWVRVPDSATYRRCMPPFGLFLALGMLSKGLVAPAVATLALAPLLWDRPRTRIAHLFGPRALVPFAAACLPWYVACYRANGRVFVDEFLVRHHFERFVNTSLQHEQPIWFFVPVVVGLLLPWSPLILGLRRETLWGDPVHRFLTAWAFLPIAFFSLSVNKLPAYILPALPPLAVLLAIQSRDDRRRWPLVASGCTLALVPLAGTLLPSALADGITRAWAAIEPGQVASGITGGLLATGLAMAGALKGRTRAVPAVAAVALASLTLLKFQAYPGTSHAAGSREFFKRYEDPLREACLGDLRRHSAYGLRHYSQDTIPDCKSQPRPYRVEGDPPRIVPSGSAVDGVP